VCQSVLFFFSPHQICLSRLVWSNRIRIESIHPHHKALILSVRRSLSSLVQHLERTLFTVCQWVTNYLPDRNKMLQTGNMVFLPSEGSTSQWTGWLSHKLGRFIVWDTMRWTKDFNLPYQGPECYSQSCQSWIWAKFFILYFWNGNEFTLDQLPGFNCNISVRNKCTEMQVAGSRAEMVAQPQAVCALLQAKGSRMR